MSYARFSEDSDVYVYLDCGGCFQCCGCSLSDETSHKDTAAILAHLQEHVAAGDDVPDRCIMRLKDEREENDAWIASHG